MALAHHSWHRRSTDGDLRLELPLVFAVFVEGVITC